MMEPESRGLPVGNLILPLAGIGLVVLIVLFVALTCGGGDANDGAQTQPTAALSPTAQVAGQAEAALAQFVQMTFSKPYAGDCSITNAATDAGKYCSLKRGEREGMQAFVLGLAFSEGERWAFATQSGGAWQVVASLEITPDSEEVPGIPWPLRIGAEVVITTGTGECLNIRTTPGGNAVDCLSEGTRIKLAAGPQTANDLEWWRVDGRDGWVAAQYLRYADSTRDPTPTVAPAGATPAASPAVTPAR